MNLVAPAACAVRTPTLPLVYSYNACKTQYSLICAWLILIGSHCSSLSVDMRQVSREKYKQNNIGIPSFPGIGDVWFSLRGTKYQNNSIVILEDIGKDGDALLCITNLTACCQSNDTAWWPCLRELVLPQWN